MMIKKMAIALAVAIATTGAVHAEDAHWYMAMVKHVTVTGDTAHVACTTGSSHWSFDVDASDNLHGGDFIWILLEEHGTDTNEDDEIIDYEFISERR